MSEKTTMETVDTLRQKLRVAERVKQAAIDCTKSWDTILDELVWERQDLDAHEIPADHLQTMIARYPHHAEALAEFAARWNADKPLSDEELASMEVDEESVKRSTAQCLLMLKWADRIRNTERERDAAREALAKLLRELESTPEKKGMPKLCEEFIRLDHHEFGLKKYRFKVRKEYERMIGHIAYWFANFDVHQVKTHHIAKVLRQRHGFADTTMP